MGGLIALVGSGEYLDVMNDVDRWLLAETGRASPRVACLPTAAGREGPDSIERWSTMGAAHFAKLGADAESVPVVDRASADDARLADRIRAADLIYFSGGDPDYLYRSLAGSLAWQAVEEACARGAVFAGCSAGAMIVGRYVPNSRSLNFKLVEAFGWLADCVVVPHFDRLPLRPVLTWLIRRRLPRSAYALGIDENTALVGRVDGEWQVMGASSVSILTRRANRRYLPGSRLALPA
jgi:cyanophycinase